MSKRNIRPIYLMYEPLPATECNAVLYGISSLLQLAQVEQQVAIQNFAYWHQGKWRDNNQLVAYYSIEWYLEQARLKSTRPNQLNAETILDEFQREPWQQEQPHYDIMVCRGDLYSAGTKFVIGLAQPGLGTVISVYRFHHLAPDTASNCIVTETMHELAHVFGVPGFDRNDLMESLGRHCPNRCIMRQGLTVPDDWIKMTNDRLEHGPFCEACIADLRAYFTA